MADSLPFTRAAAATRKGTTHALNEDAWRGLDAGHLLVKRQGRGVLYAVADGVSSSRQGQYAAQMTCDSLERFFQDGGEADPKALRNLLLGIDTELSGGGRGQAACTLSALWLYAGQAHVLHVGNSEILRLRDGELVALTPEAGQGSRRQLKSFVGMGKLDQVLLMNQAPFQFGDVFLLITDGVREAVPTLAGMASLWASTGGEPERFAQAIVEAAEERSVEDDATIVVAQIMGMETIRLQVMKSRVR